MSEYNFIKKLRNDLLPADCNFIVEVFNSDIDYSPTTTLPVSTTSSTNTTNTSTPPSTTVEPSTTLNTTIPDSTSTSTTQEPATTTSTTSTSTTTTSTTSICPVFTVFVSLIDEENVAFNATPAPSTTGYDLYIDDVFIGTFTGFPLILPISSIPGGDPYGKTYRFVALSNGCNYICSIPTTTTTSTTTTTTTTTTCPPGSIIVTIDEDTGNGTITSPDLPNGTYEVYKNGVLVGALAGFPIFFTTIPSYEATWDINLVGSPCSYGFSTTTTTTSTTSTTTTCPPDMPADVIISIVADDVSITNNTGASIFVDGKGLGIINEEIVVGATFTDTKTNLSNVGIIKITIGTCIYCFDISGAVATPTPCDF